MNNLTDHQWAIMVAMLQGKRIEIKSYAAPSIINDSRFGGIVWRPVSDINEVFMFISIGALRIAPGQDDDVTLYGQISKDEDDFSDDYYIAFNTVHNKDYDTHKITISKNGTIVGGKL